MDFYGTSGYAPIVVYVRFGGDLEVNRESELVEIVERYRINKGSGIYHV